MKKIFMAALMMAVCLTAGAKKKEVKEVLFGVKSGVITVTSDMGEMPDFSAMGMGGGGLAAFGDSTFLERMNSFNSGDMREQIYFDDYGKKTARISVYGENITRTISVGDSTYTINEKENTATVMPIFGGARNGRSGGMGGFGGGFGMGGAQIGQLGTIDWLNLDKKTIRRNKIKELGEEVVAGVTCKKYSMSPSNQMGFTQNITVCVYEGIPLSTVTESDWATTSQTAQNFIAEDVDPAFFVLPKGCKVSEMNMGGFGGDFMMMGGDFGGGFGGGGFGGGMGGGFGGGFGGF